MPYKELLKGYTFTPIENADNNTTCELPKITSKEVYKKLVQKICETPFQQKVWNRLFKTENIAYEHVYTCKIKIIDKKLAEFNYKVLHLILPCKLNLYRWGLCESNICDICRVTHDIPHLLFHCEKAKAVWHVLSNILNEDISLNDIVLNQDPEKSMLFTIISFSIYKEWLTYGKKENWKSYNIISNVKLDLFVKIKFYENIVSLANTVKLLKHIHSNFVK